MTCCMIHDVILCTRKSRRFKTALTQYLRMFSRNNYWKQRYWSLNRNIKEADRSYSCQQRHLKALRSSRSALLCSVSGRLSSYSRQSILTRLVVTAVLALDIYIYIYIYILIIIFVIYYIVLLHCIILCNINVMLLFNYSTTARGLYWVTLRPGASLPANTARSAVEIGNLCNIIWYDMIRYDMMLYDMIWYDMI